MHLVFARDEKVYVPIENIRLVQKYVNADGTTPKLSKLGEKAWKKTRSKVAKTVENIAEELADIYAERKARKGFALQLMIWKCINLNFALSLKKHLISWM